MMRPTLLLFAAFAIQIFAQECKEKKSLNLKDGLKMKCRRGEWTPVVKRSGPSGPPCEDDSSLLDQCSNDQGHCHQYTDKGVQMDKDCPGTCGACDSCRCQDASQWHTYCPYWAQYCDSPGVLGAWMGDNCRKTCNKCKCGCCSYKGKKHGLGAVIPLAGQCGALVCEEGLIAGPSTLLPGASLHNVSHPEELTLSFKSMFPGSDCCILPADAEDGGTVLKNQSMVQEGWSGRLNKDGMAVQATCCHGTLSVPLEDAVLRNMRKTPSSAATTTPSSSSTTTADCAPEDITVVSGDKYSDHFGVHNIFTHNKGEPTHAGFWLGPEQRMATFIINLGCLLRFSGIQLVNTHNYKHKDRSSKRFRLFASQLQTGPWTKVLEASIVDSRNQADPLPLQKIDLQATTTAQFLKFELLEWYGRGGGLQYFDIQRLP